ncbi:hypothetical protein PPACK8108_LOCUS15675 [Phakopsora pachyrhizi]|uniref:Uncharacterized protein n=1 Tax=Phakopsora pachyrhizi TaxID=170000 RepID=A0AAV0BBY6_PHAPC|nr:hypothetical protein PPACK8108_LOCUS15675 [Phakopsora pachyrhizi]
MITHFPTAVKIQVLLKIYQFFMCFSLVFEGKLIVMSLSSTKMLVFCVAFFGTGFTSVNFCVSYLFVLLMSEWLRYVAS